MCPASQLCLPRAEKPSAEPSLAAAAESVGTTYLEKPQRLFLPKGRSKSYPCVSPHLHFFVGVCCSPVKWVTNCKTFRGNQIKTPLKLLPFAWLHVSTESPWEQVLQCLPALMGTCVAVWGHSGSAQKVDYGQHMQTEVYSSEGAP